MKNIKRIFLVASLALAAIAYGQPPTYCGLFIHGEGTTPTSAHVECHHVPPEQHNFVWAGMNGTNYAVYAIHSGDHVIATFGNGNGDGADLWGHVFVADSCNGLDQACERSVARNGCKDVLTTDWVITCVCGHCYPMCGSTNQTISSVIVARLCDK